MSAGVFAAARRVRVFLPDLVPDDDLLMDGQLAELLNGERRQDTEDRLREVLMQRPATAMFLDAVLDDEPLFRPPLWVEQLARGAAFNPLPGAHVPPRTDRYCCPHGDLEWFSPGVSTPVPTCPTHGALEPC